MRATGYLTVTADRDTLFSKQAKHRAYSCQPDLIRAGLLVVGWVLGIQAWTAELALNVGDGATDLVNERQMARCRVGLLRRLR